MSKLLPLSDDIITSLQAGALAAYKERGSKLVNTIASNIHEQDTFDQVSPTGVFDYYHGEWVNDGPIDMSDPERQSMLHRSASYGLGRISDDLVLVALSKATQIVPAKHGNLSADDVSVALNLLKPKGQMYGVVGWAQWSDLLLDATFANAPYLMPEDSPWPGTQAKRWKDAIWMPHSALPHSSENIRKCYLYTSESVAHWAGDEVKLNTAAVDDEPIPRRFLTYQLSQGATLVDDMQVVAIPCLEYK